MSVQTQIDRLESAKEAIATAITGKGVIVPDGTKLDGMASLIGSIKGGLSVDVVTASALPATVTDGQIVAITDTSPGAVYIDTDEPASPASGDLWIKLEAGADATLVLSEDPPYVRGGLTSAAQWDGSTWVPSAGYLGVTGSWKKFAEALPPIGTALNDLTWEQISAIATAGKAPDYFSVGDAKEIVINGTVGNNTFSNLSVWAFILGFNHNSTLEGSNTIHFQISKNGQNSSNGICLVDSKLDSTVNTTGYFSMNSSATNSGGWEGCQMRTTILGNNSTPTDPQLASLIAALPADLRSAMKGVRKYSDNTGGGSDTASNITATTDYLWLLSEYEVTGAKSIANSAEQTYQKQYAYYANGNSKVFYKHNATDTAAGWWLRSVHATDVTYFCHINSSGTSARNKSNYSRGVAPAFCV